MSLNATLCCLTSKLELFERFVYVKQNIADQYITHKVPIKFRSFKSFDIAYLSKVQQTNA